MSYDGLPDRTRTAYKWRHQDGPFDSAGFSLGSMVAFLRLSDPVTIETRLSSLIGLGPVSAWWSSRSWDVPMAPINPMELGERPVYDLETSTITASSEMPRATWPNVRIIPFVETPDAARLVDGMLLKDAFLEMVMDDILVDRARDDITGIAFTSDDGTPILRNDPTLGLHYFAKVDVCANENTIAHTIQKAVCARTKLSGRQYAAMGLSNYFARISQRSARFMAKLRTGDILAFGQPEKGKDRIAIDPNDWQRPGLAVDFERGDMIDTKRDVIEWRSIQLSAPMPATEAESPFDLENSDLFERKANKLERSSTLPGAPVVAPQIPPSPSCPHFPSDRPKRQTLDEPIRAAFYARWPDGVVPPGISAKERNEILRTDLFEKGIIANKNRPSDAKFEKILPKLGRR